MNEEMLSELLNVASGCTVICLTTSFWFLLIESNCWVEFSWGQVTLLVSPKNL